MDTRTIRRLLQGSCATVVSFAPARATENPHGMHGEGAAVLIPAMVSPARRARHGERTAPMAGRPGIPHETPGAPAGLAHKAASLTLQGLTPAEHEILLESETVSARQHILLVAGATTSFLSPVATCRRAAARRIAPQHHESSGRIVRLLLRRRGRDERRRFTTPASVSGAAHIRKAEELRLWFT